MDSNGNLYLVGWASSTSLTLGSTTLTGQGAANAQYAVLMKVDSSGAVQWAQQFGDGATASKAVRGPQNQNVLFRVLPDSHPDLSMVDGCVLCMATAQDMLYDIQLDSSNNLYVAGRFRSASLTVGKQPHT